MLHTMGPGRPIRDAELLEAYARVVRRQPEELASEIPFLLSGIETIQTRLIESLYDLACLAQEFPVEAKAIAINRSTLPSTQPNRNAFATAFERVIVEYGDRLCYQKIPEYPVEIPLPWREAREQVWEMIHAYLPLARQGGKSLREIREATKTALDQRIETLCASALEAGTDPSLVEDFRSKLSYARRNAFSLDEHNHYIDQLSEGQFVQALLHAGRWLSTRGILPDPLSVFWLHTDEVVAALRGSSDGLEEILSMRQAEFTEWQALYAPACLGLPFPELPGRPVNPERAMEPSLNSVNLPANALTGEPASRGHATGKARLMDGDHIPADICPGDILVGPFASPVVIALLPAVAGVILDYGGPGDHFAITAREFGIPAVCGTIHATRLISEGDQVIVDADSGFVTWA
jgi:pyruvate,water dikinase